MDRDCDLIIIGAGPAGITAGIYAARLGINFKMLTKSIGGQISITKAIENYTGFQFTTGQELTEKFENHLREFKFGLEMTEVKSIKKTNGDFEIFTKNKVYKCKTVIVATGAHPRRLNIPGEVQYIGKGVSYCATCDGPFFRGKTVAVMGGGNSGLEAVLQLMLIAKKVYLIQISERLTGEDILIEKVKKNSKVEILLNTMITKISGDQVVKELTYIHEGKDKRIKIDGVFVNIGYVPNTEIVKGVLNLNAKKEIIVDYCCNTDLKGIFAAGDCTNVPFKQIVVATGEGCKAALSVNNYLNNIKNGKFKQI